MRPCQTALVLPVGTRWTDGACSGDQGGTSVVVASSAATVGGCAATGLRLPSAAHLLDPLEGEEQRDVLADGIRGAGAVPEGGSRGG